MAEPSIILYIGIGAMGYPIAATLAKSFPVRVWNRTASKSEAHASEHGTQALLTDSPFSDDISDISFVITCLPTSNEVNLFTEQLIAS